MSKVCLADDVQPSHYDLDLTVEDSLFKGLVRIMCRALKSITSFEFNSKGLKFTEVKILQGEKHIPCECTPVVEGAKKDEFHTITLSEPLAGAFTLVIGYTGEYGNLDGFYKAQDGDNFLFSTQFEPTDARKAFPCFDQPDMKATFKLSIQCASKYIALGNGEIEKTEDHGETKTVHFEVTPKMSTYIIAWCIGDLKHVERKDNAVTVRVFCKEEELAWAKYSLDVAFHCLKFFEEYFAIKYPLPKADLVSIPSFASGAMENWGLITFRKTSLLFDPKNSFIRSKKIIANTVCHELAHMWFGNLVTMKWWNDLWLNEGFATWAASLAMRELGERHQGLVDWDEEANFASSDIEGGLIADCLKNTHKIAVPVENPDDIDQIFDAISYDKGSSVIKMLEAWMGPEHFRDGIRSYLATKQYGNAETADLWKSLNEKRGTPDMEVSEMMSHWIDRDGYPCVIVTEEGDSIVLTQKRFTMGYEKTDAPWPIPMAIRWFGEDGGQEVEKFVFKDETMKVPRKGSIYKLNDGMTSFIRVQHPKKVLTQLLKKNLSPVNTLNLVADLYEFGFALKGEFLFEVIDDIKECKNYEVLENLLLNLQSLRSAFYDIPELLKKFTDLQNTVLSIHVKKIDLSKKNAKNVNDLAIDSLCATLGCSNGIFKVESKDVHQEFMKNYFVTLADSDYAAVKSFYETSNLPGVKESALMALGKTTKKENITSLLSGEAPWSFVRKHDVHYFAYAFGSSIHFRNEFAQFIMDNFDEFEKYVDDAGMFRSVYTGAFKCIYEPQMKQKVVEFLQKKLTEKPQHERVILKVLDNLSAIEKLREKIIAEHQREKKAGMI